MGNGRPALASAAALNVNSPDSSLFWPSLIRMKPEGLSPWTAAIRQIRSGEPYRRRTSGSGCSLTMVGPCATKTAA